MSDLPSPPVDRRREKALVAALGLIYVFSYFQRVAVPGTLFNELQSDAALAAGGALSASAVAGLGTLYLSIYGAAQLFVGLLTDRWGGVRVAWWAGAVLAAGSCWFAMASSLGELYAARTLVSVGACALYVPLVRELALRSSPARFGGWLALAMSAGFGGALLGTYPAAWAVSTWGWRPTMLAAGLATAAAWAALHILARGARDPLPDAPTEPFSWRGLVRTACSRDVALVCGVAALNFAGYFTLVGAVGKKLLQDAAGFGSEGAALVVLALSVAAMAANFGASAAARRTDGRIRGWVLLLVSCAALGALVMLWTLARGGPTAGYVLPYGLFALSQGGNLLLTMYLKERVAPARVAGAIGLVNGACYLGAAMAVTAAGAVLDRFRDGALAEADGVRYPAAAYQALFVVLLAVAALAAAGAGRLRENRPRENGGALREPEEV